MEREDINNDNRAKLEAKKRKMDKYCRSSVLFFIGFLIFIIIGLYGVWFLENIFLGVIVFIICFALVMGGVMSTAKYCTIRAELKKGKPAR